MHDVWFLIFPSNLDSFLPNLLGYEEIKMQGEFKPRLEVDELSVALGNKEHPSHMRGVSSRLGLNHGFPQEASSYRTRQRYKDDLFDTLCKKADEYIDEKIN